MEVIKENETKSIEEFPVHPPSMENTLGKSRRTMLTMGRFKSSFLSFLYREGDEESQQIESSAINRLILQEWPHLSLTLSVSFIGWTCFLIMGGLGWPGKTNYLNCREDYLINAGCFCERPRPDKIMAQPANTISNIIFNLVAIFISWCADTKKFPNPTWYSTHINFLTQSKWFSLSFGPVVANIGYSSAFLHGGWNEWGDKADSISIALLFLWLEIFSLCKFYLMITGWTANKLSIIEKAHATSFILGGIMLYIFDFTGTFSVGILFEVIGLVLILETLVVYVYRIHKGRERMSRLSLSILAIVSLGIGLALQMTTKSGSKLCNPESFFQGHALWHFFAGIAVVFIYFFFLSDKFTIRRTDHKIDRQNVAETAKEIASELVKETCKGKNTFEFDPKSSINVDDA